jgi:hypothetical protein
VRAKPSILVAAIALALAACTHEPGRSNAPPDARSAGAPVDVLIVGTDRGPLAVDATTGSIVVDPDGGVVGADGSRLFVASSDGRATLLETRDARTGEAIWTTRFRGVLDVRVVSASGRAAALMEPLAEGLDPWTPTPRRRTTIVVADPAGGREPVRHRLRGNFEPEAFSTDDGRLFLIQFLPAEAPTAYRVMVLDLTTGRVSPVRGRFDAPPERMPGIRLAQALDPDRTQLYTLYSSEAPAYADGHRAWTTLGHVPVSFVHVLNLGRGWAYCAGLPRALWGQPPRAQAITAHPSGDLLYVVDAMRGLVAVMDTRSLEVVRTEPVDLGSLGDGRTSAEVSADGHTLFVGTGGNAAAVHVLDTAALEVRDRWTMEEAVSGIGLSEDGRRLYVGLDNVAITLDVETGARLGQIPLRGVDRIISVESLSG